ncbi:hypothetical protein QCA50_006483 [Cerrena zonata]|uniref:Uncharacterized protein n=1 Tax=Cerrena zonata TaxID=2478898 RepID=A0AAW0GJA3_9APHY
MSHDNLIEQVQRLRSDIGSIYASFENVSRNLAIVSTTLSANFADDVTRLQASWNSIRQSFRKIIWDSKDLAGSARVAVNDFNLFMETVLHDHTIPLVQKRQEIAAYRNSISNHKDASRDTTDRLQNLCLQLDIFGQEWQKLMNRHKLYHIFARFRKHAEMLSEVDAQLGQLKFKIIILHVVFAALTAAGTALTIVSLVHGHFDPTMIQILPISKAWKKARKAVFEWAEKKKRREVLERELEDIKNNVGLEDIRNIAIKLGAMGTIWTSIVADLGQMENIIDLVIQDSGAGKSLSERLEIIQYSYSKLDHVFYQFQMVLY